MKKILNGIGNLILLFVVVPLVFIGGCIGITLKALYMGFSPRGKRLNQ